jgi:hypothetical protein
MHAAGAVAILTLDVLLGMSAAAENLGLILVTAGAWTVAHMFRTWNFDKLGEILFAVGLLMTAGRRS